MRGWRAWAVVLGTVGLLGGQEAAALPDLIIWGPAASPGIITTNFSADNCTVGEGCSGVGARRLLKFTTQTRNIGPDDLVMGNPTTNPLYITNACYGGFRFYGFAAYRLFNACGLLLTTAKSAYCLSDSFHFDSGTNNTPIYNCSNQGIQHGWADIYGSTTPCQWIDITGLPPGRYTLEMETNPDHLLVESDYSNNTTNFTVTIPLFDGNSNGLGDDWENLYGVTNATADADGDGQSNLQEYLAVTDPTNSASVFRVSDVAKEGEDLRVTWLTHGCRTNALERADGSADFSTNFTAIFTVTNALAGATNYLDIGAATNAPAYYYRVRLVP